MIKIFIGSHERFARVEPVIKHSILKHTSEPVDIRFLRPDYYGIRDTGCTGFTNMRFLVPHICNYEGKAIYLDVDMILMTDIVGIMDYAKSGKWNCIKDGSTEVSVIDCSAFKDITKFDVMNMCKSQLLNTISDRKECNIPMCWNCEDCYTSKWNIEQACLIHYTDLKCQPWFYDHPNKELAKIWFDLEKEALENN